MKASPTKRRSISICLLLFLSPLVVHGNPLAKFLMMKSKNDRQAGAPVSPPQPPPTPGPVEEPCVPTHTLQNVQDQLVQASATQAAADEQRAQTEALVSKLQEEHENYKKQTQAQLESLSKSSESAKKVARVQEDFAGRIAKMQQQAEADLTAAKATIAEKEQALELLREANKKQIASAEAEWKNELKLAESSKTEVVIQIQSEYEERLKELEEQKALLAGKKKALQESYDKLEGKYENLVKNREIALQAYLEVNLQKEATKLSESFRKTLEDELDQLKESSHTKIEELVSELESLKASSAATIRKWEQDYTALKEASEKTIAKLTAEYSSLQQSNEKFIEDMKKSHQLAVDELKRQTSDEWENSVAGMNTKHVEAMSSLKDQIKTFEEDRESLYEEIKSTKRELVETKVKYTQASEDAGYWEDKFQTRAYVNLTHVVEGVGALPVYESHLAPHVGGAKSLVDKSTESAFNTLSRHFGKTCPVALTILKKVENSTGLVLPPYVFEKTQYSCGHVDESVTFAIKVVLFVILLLLRSPICSVVLSLCRAWMAVSHFVVIDPVNQLLGRDHLVQAPGGGYISGTGGTPPKKPLLVPAQVR